ncbi:DUF5343 domain-containing protein [Mesorhizobium sp. RIZ17]|uniref:DUF5343 domain-containing protein n=1 Tax=Mesorhizobium sp. RIZ17 TaxID=3132743 RepID=UPI003DA7B33D
MLKKALDSIILAERPEKFGASYMTTILKMTGGAARAVPPFLKKTQFIGADGTPTILYSKFKTDGGRSQAAFDGLKNAFSELFRRNEYIHRADENSVKDTIVEITGLKKSDQIVRMMYGSFDAIRSFITADISKVSESTNDESIFESLPASEVTGRPGRDIGIGLSYQINIVLPETENIAVFNAIFKSLRDNLLR